MEEKRHRKCYILVTRLLQTFNSQYFYIFYVQLDQEPMVQSPLPSIIGYLKTKGRKILLPLRKWLMLSNIKYMRGECWGSWNYWDYFRILILFRLRLLFCLNPGRNLRIFMSCSKLWIRIYSRLLRKVIKIYRKHIFNISYIRF